MANLIDTSQDRRQRYFARAYTKPLLHTWSLAVLVCLAMGFLFGEDYFARLP